MSHRKRRTEEGEERKDKGRGGKGGRTMRRGEEEGAGEALMTVARIRQLANLSRLTLDSKEEHELIGELSSILEYFRVIDKVEDASGPGQGLTEPAEDLRADEPRPSDPDSLLRVVPQRRGRFVKAPRVF